MSELRSVLLFFIGLLLFVLIIAFVVGRLKLPSSVKVKNPFSSIFNSSQKKPKKNSNTKALTTPILTPTSYIVNQSATPTSVPNTVNGVKTIPETGSPTILLAIPALAGGIGFWLRKKS